MSRPSLPVPRGERGVALVVALLVLLVLSLLAAVMLVTINVETKITGHGLRETEALNNAEAGIGEAESRILKGDITLDASNPRAVAQIFNVAAGSVPVLGADSVGLATSQPAGAWLAYSTATRGPNTLTVAFKTDPARTVVYRYDQTKSPPVQTATGFPIYVITSTGTDNTAKRAVRTEVFQRPVPAYVYGAMSAAVPVQMKGTAFVCGHNHSASTPTGTTNTTSPDDAAFHTGSGDLTGVWSTSQITQQGTSVASGSPAYSPNMTGPYTGPNGFYSGPWDVFGMSQAQFFSWVGPPVPAPNPPNGLLNINGDTSYQGGDGQGFMYVNGNLTINGNFNYRGLLYVEGDLQINGTCWVLGALIVKGVTTVKLANGNCAVLYSSDAIQQAIASAGGSFIKLSWRELP